MCILSNETILHAQACPAGKVRLSQNEKKNQSAEAISDLSLDLDETAKKKNCFEGHLCAKSIIWFPAPGFIME